VSENVDRRLAPVLGRLPPRYWAPLAVLALIALSWVVTGGHAWAFESRDQHRFTARAILDGTLRLRGNLLLLDNDEQVYNGAAYTNWAFGVPLLQAPFHALAKALGMPGGFFPDRAIFLFYESVTIAVLFTTIRAVVAEKLFAPVSRGARLALTWAATFVVLTMGVYPLTTYRFIIYEETIAYFVLFEVLAVCAYARAARSWSVLSLTGLGIAAGIALLVRPTGLPYAALWVGVVLLEGGPRRTVPVLLALAPFAFFWLYTNDVHAGSWMALGFPNSTPTWSYNMPIERFGSRCSDTLPHELLGAVRLFVGFFFYVTRRPSSVWLQDCHFDFEERGGPLPFFGPVVLVATGVMLVRAVRTRAPITRYAPFALMAVFFALFVRRGMGFAWRYAGDFWPALFLAGLHYVRASRPIQGTSVASLYAKGTLVYGAWLLAFLVIPPAIPEMAEDSPAQMERRYEESRTTRTPLLPSRIECGDRMVRIVGNGFGWDARCGVDTYTNVVLGVPPGGSTYTIRATTDDMRAESVRVYANGSYRTAVRAEGGYVAHVPIAYDHLWSPAVVVTFKWTDDFDPPGGKLTAVEITPE
jgi:hypothetical protein